MVSPTVFEMHCEDPWFSYIRQGVKPVEGRRNIPKYQQIRVGDYIKFSNSKEHFTAVVIDVKKYSSLERYLEDVTIEKAVPGTATFEQALKIYLQWSTPDEIRSCGFLGIFIKPL